MGWIFTGSCQADDSAKNDKRDCYFHREENSGGVIYTSCYLCSSDTFRLPCKDCDRFIDKYSLEDYVETHIKQIQNWLSEN